MRCKLLHWRRIKADGLCWQCNLDRLLRADARRRHPSGRQR